MEGYGSRGDNRRKRHPKRGADSCHGVALAVGDRILVKDQTQASDNGIYVVASGAWTCAADANVSALMTSQTSVRVAEGTANGGTYRVHQGQIYGSAGTEWILITPDPIALGTTDLSFVQSNLLALDTGRELIGFQGMVTSNDDAFSITLQGNNSPLAASIAGYALLGTGVYGRNGQGSSQPPSTAVGVYGDSDAGSGIYGSSTTGVGVVGSVRKTTPSGARAPRRRTPGCREPTRAADTGYGRCLATSAFTPKARPRQRSSMARSASTTRKTKTRSDPQAAHPITPPWRRPTIAAGSLFGATATARAAPASTRGALISRRSSMARFRLMATSIWAAATWSSATAPSNSICLRMRSLNQAR